MYSHQEYSSANHIIPASEREVQSLKKVRREKKRLWRKAIADAFSVAISGSVAGRAFYDVNALLENSQTMQTLYTLQEDDIKFSGVSYSSNSTAASQSLDVSGIAAQELTPVVLVTNIGQFGRNGRGQTQLQETASCGSGVIVCADDSCLHMATNYHAAEGATTLSVTFVDGQTCEAILCGYDESMDIALLKVVVDTLSSATLSQISAVAIGDSDELVVGEQVVAIGNVLGFGQSVTTGIVSALDRSISTDTGASTYIQTGAAFNPDKSSDALLNMNGELVRINTAKVSSSDVEDMGYAIPIFQVPDLIESLMA